MPDIYGIRVRNSSGDIVLDSNAVGWTEIDRWTYTGEVTNQVRNLPSTLPSGITASNLKAVHIVDNLNSIELFTKWGINFVNFDYTISVSTPPKITYSLDVVYFPIFGNTLATGGVETTISVYVK